MTLGTHFCGGKDIETKILLGETHLGCGMLDMEEACNNSKQSNQNRVSFNKVPCCQNEFQTIQVTTNFVKEAAQTVFNVDFALAFVYTTLHLDLFPKSSNPIYTEYISPPLEKDIQVLFQTFLI